MGDPWSMVPDHDPHDVSSLYTVEQNFLDMDFHGLDRNPTLSDIYYPLFPPEINNYSTTAGVPPSSSSGDNGLLLHMPEEEHMAATQGNPGWGTGNSFPPRTLSTAWNTNSSGASHSYGGHGSDGGGGAASSADPSGRTAGTSLGPGALAENMRFDNVVPLSTWPMLPSPYLCSSCHVLRDIIYTKGNHMIKLELHGRPGTIIHAILENRSADNQSTSSGHHQYQMFDFCGKSIGDVKEFLLRYCEEKILAGYKLVPDPLSTYYEAVCVGLVWDNIVSGPDDFLRSSPPTPGLRGFYLQRERAGKLTLKDLAHYFHLPLENAAEILKLCPTVVKKICRRGGLKRWPHRKIRSLKKKIKKLHPRLASRDPEERQAAQADLKSLQQQLLEMRFGVPEASSSVV
ncbi:hypothetical protein SAY87_030928 [Trapa incisa]|uniref:RWP-RK domain-containing protein n=1 Tax=Trapa incisa TaxID=236973 RepID=A0AAN7KND2_9MYRT|nr:hypothetical protein SAY87_030928 [Trapa incisa]